MENFELKLEVETDNLVEVTEILVDYDITNEIIGNTEDGNILIHIEYDDDQQEGIGDLLNIAEIYENDDENTDEDDDEEEED